MLRQNAVYDFENDPEPNSDIQAIDPFNYQQNIDIGVRYLATLFESHSLKEAILRYYIPRKKPLEADEENLLRLSERVFEKYSDIRKKRDESEALPEYIYPIALGRSVNGFFYN
jgi:hypothetical protein